MPMLASLRAFGAFSSRSSLAALGLATVVGCSSSTTTPGAADASAGVDSAAPTNDASTGVNDAAPDAGDAGDAGATGVGAFVGTWGRAGTLALTCGIHEYDYPITGTLSIALGTTSDAVVGTASDTGCTETYSVAGNVASAAAGQTCTLVTDAGSQTVLTAVKHTLTVSSDGTTLAGAASDTVAITGADGGTESCTASSTGSFTKQ
jgi:hypothetical protein